MSAAAIQRAKLWWWWLSDSEWRRRYRENRARIVAYQESQRRAVQRLLATSGSTVLAGPFAGMSFSPARTEALCAQVLLGTYEREIHPTIEEICRRPYSLIVDIGADRGYYVCGLKRRMRDVRVVAFEGTTSKHDAIRALMRENELQTGLTIEGFCDSVSLQARLTGEPHPLVVCDIDGAEVEVLDPEAVPGLLNADILVETHDCIREGITDLLIRRFAPTHHLDVIPERVRTLDDAPKGTPLSDRELLSAMDEGRGFQQSWLWMTARNAGGSDTVSQ